MSMEFFEDIEESERSIVAIQRTKPLYPTEGPGDGRTWREYFQALRYVEEPVIEECVTVIEPGALLADPLKAPGAPGTLAKRLAGQDWAVSVSTSRVAVPATRYKSDSEEGGAEEYRKGDVRFAAHELETVCVQGVKRSPDGQPGLVVDATWTRKAGEYFMFEGAKTFDPILGPVWRSTASKPRAQRAWEKEDGAAAPMGLNQWLDIVCPKPKKEEK